MIEMMEKDAEIQKEIDEKRKMLNRKSCILLIPNKSPENYFLQNW